MRYTLGFPVRLLHKCNCTARLEVNGLVLVVHNVTVTFWPCKYFDPASRPWGKSGGYLVASLHNPRMGCHSYLGV